MKTKLAQFFNSPKQVSIVGIILALVLGAYGYTRIHRSPVYEYVTATSGTISEPTQSASLQDLTLGFVSGGRIASVSVKAGDTVKKGQILASLDAGNTSGAIAQAKAAYALAEANYQKILNGATSPTIDIAKAALHTALVNQTEVIKQQTTLVENARRTLLNSALSVQTDSDSAVLAPTISGAYTQTAEGTISLTVYPTSNGGYITFSGLVSGTTTISTTTPAAVGNTGLFILFQGPLSQYAQGANWHIDIPNKKASNYVSNYNAYQQALQTKDQALANADAAVTQAQANLTATVSAARPEDIAAAKAQMDNAAGALQIAQAAYANTIIVAPNDGTITAVTIAPGQITTANGSAIELRAVVTEKTVAVLVPTSAVLSRNGSSYVLKKEESRVVEQIVTTGISDDTNTEITSGLIAGDQIVIR